MGSQNVLCSFRNADEDYLPLYQPFDFGEFLILGVPQTPHL